MSGCGAKRHDEVVTEETDPEQSDVLVCSCCKKLPGNGRVLHGPFEHTPTSDDRYGPMVCNFCSVDLLRDFIASGDIHPVVLASPCHIVPWLVLAQLDFVNDLPLGKILERAELSSDMSINEAILQIVTKAQQQYATPLALKRVDDEYKKEGGQTENIY